MKSRLIACALLLFVLPDARPCPFCPSQGATLAAEVAQAELIVVGKVKNAKRNFEDPTKSTTELHISSVVKDHPFLAGRSMILLPRYLEPEANPDTQFLVFAGVYPSLQQTALGGLVSGFGLANFKDYVFDPYRGDPIGTKGELAAYLKGALEVKDKPVADRLRYYFEYLDAADLTICSDAFMEFGNAEYKDVKDLAPKLPADKLIRWLHDKNTPPSHYGLYGMLVGHCGKKADAEALRKLLDEPKKLYTSGIDGLLAGYILLDPDAGWAYLTDLIKNDKNEFATRYAGLRTLRFFWEFRPDAVKKEKMVEAYRLLLSQVDIADMPIEDMRKWNCADLHADIVALGKSPAHLDSTFVRRSLIKYLLTVGAKKEDATALLADLRTKLPDAVKAAEESLAFDRELAKPAGGS